MFKFKLSHIIGKKEYFNCSITTLGLQDAHGRYKREDVNNNLVVVDDGDYDLMSDNLPDALEDVLLAMFHEYYLNYSDVAHINN